MSSYTMDLKYGRSTRQSRTVGELKNCNSLVVFNKTIARACWIRDRYNQLGATRLVGYLPSHIQRALVELFYC